MKRISILVLTFVLLSVGSCKNALEELGSPNSDEALLYDAQAAVDRQRYQEAIDIITLRVSASAQQSTQARSILASGYAGLCGLNFLEYTEDLANSGATAVFKILSDPFVGVAVNPGACLQSLQTMSLIGPNSARTPQQNMFMAVVAMVLTGSATRDYTDVTPGPYGDGVQDDIDISCDLTDSQIDNIVLGYGYMVENFAAISSQLGGSASSISDAINICGTLSCATTDPAQINGTMRDAMRSIMNTQQYGVGDVDTTAQPIPPWCP